MHVLLATDQSASSQAAAKMVRSLRFADRCELSIIHAIPAAAMDSGKGVPLVLQSILDQECEAAQEHLDELAESFAGTCDLRSKLLAIGPPGYEIKLHADEAQVDLIVMGAIGKSMIQRVLLGSVSDFVATHVDSNVMMVRVAPGTDETEMLANVKAPSRVLVALDHSQADDRLLEFLQSFLWPDDSEAIVAHVVEDILWYQNGLSDPMPEKVVDRINTSRVEVASHVESVCESLRGTIPHTKSEVLEEPHVGEALVQCAQRHGCDLIVTGDHHRGLLDRLLLGSTSRHVLRYAQCNVCIVRS